MATIVIRWDYALTTLRRQRRRRRQGFGCCHWSKVITAHLSAHKSTYISHNWCCRHCRRTLRRICKLFHRVLCSCARSFLRCFCKVYAIMNHCRTCCCVHIAYDKWVCVCMCVWPSAKHSVKLCALEHEHDDWLIHYNSHAAYTIRWIRTLQSIYHVYGKFRHAGKTLSSLGNRGIRPSSRMTCRRLLTRRPRGVYIWIWTFNARTHQLSDVSLECVWLTCFMQTNFLICQNLNRLTNIFQITYTCWTNEKYTFKWVDVFIWTTSNNTLILEYTMIAGVFPNDEMKKKMFVCHYNGQ